MIKNLLLIFLDSHRPQHFLLGMLIGLLSNSWYCTEYTGLGVSGALEFKDKSHGGKWDWLDFLVTLLGIEGITLSLNSYPLFVALRIKFLILVTCFLNAI